MEFILPFISVFFGLGFWLVNEESDFCPMMYEAKNYLVFCFRILEPMENFLK